MKIWETVRTSVRGAVETQTASSAVMPFQKQKHTSMRVMEQMCLSVRTVVTIETDKQKQMYGL